MPPATKVTVKVHCFMQGEGGAFEDLYVGGGLGGRGGGVAKLPFFFGHVLKKATTLVIYY